MPSSRLHRFGLASRLVALAAIAALLVSTVGGWILRQSVQGTLLRHFEQRLAERTERLLAGFSVLPGSSQIHWLGRSNDEFGRIFSGWYWQLEGSGELQASRSLWDSRLDTASNRPVPGNPELRQGVDPQGLAVMGIVRVIEVDGQAAHLHVYGPAAEIASELDRLDRILLLTQLGLIVSLLLTSILQVRLGLLPLRRLRDRLAAVRTGSAASVGNDYGPELAPLAQELDLVLARNARIVDRARGHAADLSHALKKPLSLLAADGELQRNALLRQQVGAMTQLIDRHLARAGSGAGSVRQVAVGDCIDSLIGLMQRLHRERGLSWQLDVNRDLHWRGEQTDFEEMLGNLLDNAGKWARSRVSVRARRQHDEVVVEIGDDGPGLSAEQIRETGVRGRRFDEDVEGSGLGLAITGDIAETYAGELSLGRSPLGGLLACLRLPG
jgi:signal transduction histidine kinase